jgi:hypothetical protein
MPTTTTASATREWPAWAGDVDRLARLCKTTDELIAERRWSWVEGEASRRVDDYGDAPAEALAEANRQAETKWTTEVEAYERELQLRRAGSPADVLAEIDPAAIHRLTIRAPSFGGSPIRCQVDFGESEGHGSCRLRVEGDDPQWVRGAISTLESEIGRGVPDWAWLRSGRGQLAMVAAFSLAIAVALWPLWSDVDEGAPRTAMNRTLLSAIMGAFLGFFLGVIAFVVVTRTLLPGFELLQRGQKGRGSRAVAVMSGLLAAVAIGFVVNWLS